MKNCKNNKSDASLQVDHLGDVHGPGLEPVLPSERLSQKMYRYHLDRAPWSLAKTHNPLYIF